MKTTIKCESLSEITCANQRVRGIRHFVGFAKSLQFKDVSDDPNVRTGMRREGDVHRAIGGTISDSPEQMTELNSGLTFCAKSVKLNKDTRTLELEDLGLVNGSQTRKVLNEYLDENDKPVNIVVKVEFIITNDEDYISEISVARNFQTRVKDISIYGSEHLFDDIDDLFMTAYKKHVRMSETDDGSEVIDTYRVLQVAFILMDIDFARKYLGDRAEKFFEVPNKVYGQKAWVLKSYNEFFTNDVLKRDFFHAFNQFAVEAWRVYQKLVHHTTNRQRNCSVFDFIRKYQEENYAPGKELLSGIAFPVLYSLRPFVSIKGAKGKELINIDTTQFESPTNDEVRSRTRAYNRVFEAFMEKNSGITDTVAKTGGDEAIYTKLLVKAMEIQKAA